jgi:hypothetical protein
MFTSCNGSVLNVRDYIEYVRNPSNDLISKSVSNGYIFRLQYLPSNYLSLIETRGKIDNYTQLDSLSKKFDSYTYFDLAISSGGNNTLHGFSDSSLDRNQMYLAFDLTNRLYFVASQDTFKCLMYHLENSGSISPEYHMQLIFPPFSGIQSDSIRFCFEDSILSKSHVNITMKLNSILQTPDLKL